MTVRQAERTKQFLSMIPAHLRGGVDGGDDLRASFAAPTPPALPRVQEAPPALPDVAQLAREGLREQVRKNRGQRRAASRARLGELLEGQGGDGSHEEARREGDPISAPQGTSQSIREAYSARARVVVRPVQERQPDEGPQVAALDELLDLAPLRPKRGRGAGQEGAGRLARLLDAISRYVLKARRYRLAPSQIVFHMSQELLAAALEVDKATIRRWTRQLETLGYCHSRPHFSDMTVEGKRVTAADGLLFAVRLKPGHRAHLTYDDLAHEWRDLDADRQAGRTAWAILKAVRQAQEKARQDGEKNLRGSVSPSEVGISFHQLKIWAVTPGTNVTPLSSDPRNFEPDEPQTVQDVVYALPLVLDAHPTKRAALVGLLGSALARNLNDQHSRRWYCRIIWDAYTASLEGRAGLQVLAAQLARLDADRHEWLSLHNPAALLVARLRYPPVVQA